MTADEFQAAAFDIYQNYWRIKAANNLYRSLPIAADSRLDYTNVPSVGLSALSAVSESVADAIAASTNFIARRLRRDLFLATIAEFESRLATKLASLGLSSDGTLGNLQVRLQQRLALPVALIQDLDEVRERRNAMIHNADLANQKYVSASAAIQPRAAPFVSAAAIGNNVSPSDIYFAYAIDVLVRYSTAIG